MGKITGEKNPGKVLVTGGGGFLGRAVVERLLAKDEIVVSFSRGRYPELEEMGVHCISGDIRDKDAVDDAVRGAGLVFHIAAKPGVWGNFEDYYGINVTGTRNFIAACKKHKVAGLVYTGSPSVVFNGTNMEGVDESVPYAEVWHAHYPKTKATAEQRVREAAAEGLPTVVLRPHLIWGPRDNHLVPRILARAKKLVRVGDGKNLVDTIYIDNAADAHILAAEKLLKNPEISGKVYFISQDEPIPLWEMVDKILAAGGYPPVKRSISPKTALWIGALSEWMYNLLGLKGEPKMTRFVANELATSHWFDIRAAKTDLGYRPAVSTEEGLRRLAQWISETKR